MRNDSEPAVFLGRFSALSLPNTAVPTITPVITGNPGADQRIRDLAETLGYERQAMATGELVIVDDTIDDGRLQPSAAQGWAELWAAAARAGITLELVSGFRSLPAQRSLFADRLRAVAVQQIGRAYSGDEISAGIADRAIGTVLARTAPPGYSRHHSGYALDLNDTTAGLPFTCFRVTAGYRWLAADHFTAATNCGFVPSYPDGVPALGPGPEPWEFVWVGADLVHQVLPGWR